MITIFTGAGASKALDYPTTAEFFTTGSGKKLKDDIVFKSVIAHLKTQTPDVEDVLRLLTPFSQLDKTPTGDFIFPHLNRSRHWLQGVPNFVKITNQACFDHYGTRPDEEKVRNLYLPLFELCNWDKEHVSFYTTNYDPVTDVLMEIAINSGVECYDGFNRLTWFNREGYSKIRSTGLAIYRLHGTMSWIEDEKRGNIKNTRDNSLRSPGSAEHIMIFPGFKGNPELEGNEVIRYSHRQLRSELNETTTLLVIGFSFRDPHLNAIFRDSLANNKKLIMVVWNPIWPEGPDVGLADLKKEYTNRIIPFESKFGDEGAILRLQTLLKL